MKPCINQDPCTACQNCWDNIFNTGAYFGIALGAAIGCCITATAFILHVFK